MPVIESLFPLADRMCFRSNACPEAFAKRLSSLCARYSDEGDVVSVVAGEP
jgi:hypothetical protein